MEEKKQGIGDRFRKRKETEITKGHVSRSKRRIIRSYKSPGEK